jgi:hypothetical protein
MRITSLLVALALGLVASCAGTSPSTAPLELRVEDAARVHLEGLRLDPSGELVTGRLVSSYPSMPVRRRVEAQGEGGEVLSVEAPRQSRTRRHKRPQRARFELRLP